MNKISTIKKEYLKEEFIKQIGDSYTLNLSMVLLEEFEELQQELTKYKERCEKAVEYVKRFDFEYLHECYEHNLVEVLENLLEILEDKENK